VEGTGNASSPAMSCFVSLLLSRPPEDASSIESHSLLDSSASQTREDLQGYSQTVILMWTNSRSTEQSLSSSDTDMYDNRPTEQSLSSSDTDMYDNRPTEQSLSSSDTDM